MPWVLPSNGASMTKAVFSNYRTIESCDYFDLQEKKVNKFNIRWPHKRNQVRPTYRIATRSQGSRPPMKIAYSDDLEQMRETEWKFCRTDFKQLIPPDLPVEERWKWMNAFFTKLAISDGAEVGEAKDKKEEDDDNSSDDKKAFFSASKVIKNIRSVFRKETDREKKRKLSRSSSPVSKANKRKSREARFRARRRTSVGSLPWVTKKQEKKMTEEKEGGLMTQAKDRLDLSCSPTKREGLPGDNALTKDNILLAGSQGTGDKSNPDDECNDTISKSPMSDRKSLMSDQQRRSDVKAEHSVDKESRLGKRKAKRPGYTFIMSDVEVSDFSDFDSIGSQKQNHMSPNNSKNGQQTPSIRIPLRGNGVALFIALCMAANAWFAHDLSKTAVILALGLIVTMLFSIIVLGYPCALLLYIEVER